jgi:hypothetical protein
MGFAGLHKPYGFCRFAQALWVLQVCTSLMGFAGLHKLVQTHKACANLLNLQNYTFN